MIGSALSHLAFLLGFIVQGGEERIGILQKNLGIVVLL